MSKLTRRARFRLAFITIDILFAMMLLTALGSILAVGAHLRQRNSHELANQRRSFAVAQQALTNLQTGGELPTVNPAAKISIDRTGRRVGSLEWIEVNVVLENRHASIVGLAPSTQPRGAQ